MHESLGQHERGWQIPAGNKLEETSWKGADIVFLFHPKERPGLADLKSAIAKIPGAHCDAELPSEEGTAASAVLVLQKGGMTYDCTGFKPNSPAEKPANLNRLDTDLQENHLLLEGIGLSLGPHVRAGQASLPVLKALIVFAALLTAKFKGVAGVCWAASGKAVDSKAFAALVNGWVSGGAMPLTLLFGSKDAIDGGMESRGLRYFTGQELRFEPDFVRDRQRADQLNLRLAERLFHVGRFETAEQVTAPDGMPLWLEPSPNGRFVRVRAL